MDKIYKLVWSNIKNCYVVTSKLSKNHKKSPKSFNKTLVAGVLSCVFSCGFTNLGYAYTVIGSGTAGIQLDEFHSNIVSTTLNENARKAINVVSHNGQVLVLNDSYYGGTLSNDAKAVQTALKDLIVSGTGVAPKDLTDPYFVVEAVLDDTLQTSYLVHYIGSDDNTQYIKLTTAEAENIGLRKFLSTPWVTENGNYITKDKDVVQNLQALDTKTADLDTIVAGHTTDIAELKDLSNITDAGESVVRSLAQSAVKVVDGTNTTVTEGTDGTYKTYTVNVIGNGSVASGNTGLINGGTLYNEVRPASDGTNVLRGNTVGQNLLSLDSKIVTLSDKVYNRCFGINSTMTENDFANSIIDEMEHLTVYGNWTDALNAYNTKYSNKGGIGAVGDQTITISHLNVAEGTNSIVIGNDAAAMVSKKPDGTVVDGTGTKDVVIGNHAYSRTNKSVAIGLGAYNETDYFGDDTTDWDTTYHIYGTNAVAVGADAHTKNSYGTVVGAASTAFDKGTVLGYNSYAPVGSISIGYQVSPRSVKVFDADDVSASMITIGYKAYTEIGRQHYTGISPVAIGHEAYADESMAIGAYAKANNGGIAIGQNARTMSRDSDEAPTAIFNPEGSIVIGNSAQSHDGYTGKKGGNVILGNHAIGSNSSFSVALGAYSSVNDDYVVSVGNPNPPSSVVDSSTKLTRRIVNVRNGVNLSDAATVDQVTAVSAGDGHIKVDVNSPSSGIKNSKISVITTDYIKEGNTNLVTSDTINSAINKNSTLIAGSGITIQKNYTEPQYQTIGNIIESFETNDDKYDGLRNLFNKIEYLTGMKANEQVGVSQNIYERLMSAILNGSASPYLTQDRYDALLATSIMVEPADLESKTISLNINPNGAITKNNQDLIVGGVVYDEVRPADGKYVRTANTVAQNLASIDSSMVGYDNSFHSILTLDGSSGTKVTNLKPATLSATSTDAVIGAQLYATNENIAGFATDITRNKNNIASLNTSVTAALGSVGATSTLVTTLDNTKADISLNNLSNAGKQVISNAAINAVQEYMALQNGNNEPANPVAPMMYNSNPNTLHVTNAGNGSLFVGEGSNVNGSQSIAIGVGNQVNANNAGAFGDPSIINADESYVLGNDDTVNTGAVGSFIVGNDSVSNAKGSLLFGSNSKTEISAENSVGLGNNISVTGKNSVALGYQSTALEDNTISVGNDFLKRRIVNVLDGNLSADSSDAVTGRQLFATNEKIEENAYAILQKADKDGSNIDAIAWTQKLGTGRIEENNTNLVTGGTVYNAFVTMEQNVPVQATDEAIFIGANRSDNMISVYNQNGESRVITGVATNADDTSSAANVAYVNAVASNVLENVNGRFVETDKRMNKVGANAAALASLIPASFEGDEKWSLAAAVGHYKGETAGAVGAFYKPTENVMMNVRGAVGNGENMLGAGVAVSLTKGDIPGVTKRQLANTVNRQAEAINQLQQNQQIMIQQIKELTERLEVAENRK